MNKTKFNLFMLVIALCLISSALAGGSSKGREGRGNFGRPDVRPGYRDSDNWDFSDKHSDKDSDHHDSDDDDYSDEKCYKHDYNKCKYKHDCKWFGYKYGCKDKDYCGFKDESSCKYNSWYCKWYEEKSDSDDDHHHSDKNSDDDHHGGYSDKDSDKKSDDDGHYSSYVAGDEDDEHGGHDDHKDESENKSDYYHKKGKCKSKYKHDYSDDK